MLYETTITLGFKENEAINYQSSQNYGNAENINLNVDHLKILTNIRMKNLNRPMIGHINIHFLYSKYEALKCLIKDKLDILVVTETKLDASYTSSQFEIEGFTNPFRLDRHKNGRGVMIFVKSHLSAREIPFGNKPHDIEVISLELTLRTKKWPMKEYASYFFGHVSRHLDIIIASYDHILILGDFNETIHDEVRKIFVICMILRI